MITRSRCALDMVMQKGYAAPWQVARNALAALHGEPDVKEVEDSAESKVCFCDIRHDECQHHAYCCTSAATVERNTEGSWYQSHRCQLAHPGMTTVRRPTNSAPCSTPW
jgi:hypothetical protein